MDSFFKRMDFNCADLVCKAYLNQSQNNMQTSTMFHFAMQKKSMEHTLMNEGGKPYFELSPVQLSSAHTYLPMGYVCLASPTQDEKERISVLENLISDARKNILTDTWLFGEGSPFADDELRQVVQFVSKFNKTTTQGMVANLCVIAGGLQTLLEAFDPEDRPMKKRKAGSVDWIADPELRKAAAMEKKRLLDAVKSFMEYYTDPNALYIKYIN